MTRLGPPTPKPPADQRWLDAIHLAHQTRADLAVSIAIDGIALVDSASVQDASHEVRVQDGRAVKCSCWPSRRGLPCVHRAYVAIRLWEEEMGADLTEVGARALLTTLKTYLTPPKRPFARWWLASADQPEARNALPEPVGEFV